MRDERKIHRKENLSEIFVTNVGLSMKVLNCKICTMTVNIHSIATFISYDNILKNFTFLITGFAFMQIRKRYISGRGEKIAPQINRGSRLW